MIRRLAIDGAVAAILATLYIALYFRAFPRPGHLGERDWRDREPLEVA